MSNVVSKPLKRYVVLRTEENNKLILLKFVEDHLDNYEKELVKVLRNKVVDSSQRLKLYQNI